MELFDTRFFEMLFLICFGISWPMNIVKAVRGKTSKGVSLWFLLVCFIGYIFGIIAKLVDDTLSYTLILLLSEHLHGGNLRRVLLHQRAS